MQSGEESELHHTPTRTMIRIDHCDESMRGRSLGYEACLASCPVSSSLQRMMAQSHRSDEERVFECSVSAVPVVKRAYADYTCAQ